MFVLNKFKKNRASNLLSYRHGLSRTDTLTVFVSEFTPCQQFFSFLTMTVHKSLFPGLFLTRTKLLHYPETDGPVVVLFLQSSAPRGKASTTSLKDLGLWRPGIEPMTSRSRRGRSNH